MIGAVGWQGSRRRKDVPSRDIFRGGGHGARGDGEDGQAVTDSTPLKRRTHEDHTVLKWG
jgi:hypothetical protein